MTRVVFIAPRDELRDQLGQRPVRSEVQLADRILDFLTDHYGQIVFDQARLWRYDGSSGMFMLVEEAEIANIIYDLDGIPYGARGTFEASASKAKALIKIINHRIGQTDFFLGAATGVAVTNGFLTEQRNRVVLKSHSLEHRQQTRLEIDYKPDADASAIWASDAPRAVLWIKPADCSFAPTHGAGGVFPAETIATWPIGSQRRDIQPLSAI